MTPPVTLLTVPYDRGRRDRGLGRGPAAWLAGGAVERLGGAAVVDVVLERGLGELASAFATARTVADEVRAARAARRAPVVLAGHCGASLGVVAGLPPRTGVLWLDAHGDLQLPSTTTSGFVDGMSLSAVTGRCWEALAATVRGFAPVPDEHVLLVGAHALDPAEERLLAASAIEVLTTDLVRAGGAAQALRALAGRVDRLHVHVDLDVHDVTVGRANAWSASGGLSTSDVRDVVRAAADQVPLVSATLASWDPSVDADGAVRDAGLDLLALLGELLTAP